MAGPDAIVRKGFRYDGAFTTTDGISFESPEKLRQLCFPRDPEQWTTKAKRGRGRPRKLDDISEADAESTLSRKFVLAQFRLYGLPVPYKAAADEAVETFRQQVGAGKFRKMPRSVEKLREEMAAEWDGAKLVAQGPSKGRGRPKASATVDAGAKAQPRGRGRSKATATENADVDVQARGRGRPAKDSAGQGTAKKAAQATKTATGAAAKGSASKVQPSSSVVGHYDVTCKSIQEEWDNTENLSLDIASTSSPGIYKASFDFGVLEGLMYLSADNRQLAAHIGRPGAKWQEDKDGSMDEDDDKDEDEEEEARVGGKRKATTTTSGAGPAAKRTKTSSAPTTFFLQWRGRETGEGVIQLGEHRGKIKFTNQTYKKFTAKMDLVFVGDDKTTLSGTKVSDMPKSTHGSWEDFSESAYEEAQANRW